MIFATVGTQLPFDRLLSGLNSWAERNPGIPVLAQTGVTARRFRAIETATHLSQSDFQDRFEAARLIVAHAGMGTILSAAELGKPLILMPRRARFGEHRNDHQQDTAREMARLSNVTIAEDGEALHAALDLAVARGFETPQVVVCDGAGALDPLIDVIRDFVWKGRGGAATKTPSARKDAA